MRPGTRAERMRCKVSSSSMAPLTRRDRVRTPRRTAAVCTPVTAAWAWVRVTRLGSASPVPAVEPALAPAAATSSMPQIVQRSPGLSDLIQGCMGHW